MKKLLILFFLLFVYNANATFIPGGYRSRRANLFQKDSNKFKEDSNKDTVFFVNGYRLNQFYDRETGKFKDDDYKEYLSASLSNGEFISRMSKGHIDDSGTTGIERAFKLVPIPSIIDDKSGNVFGDVKIDIKESKFSKGKPLNKKFSEVEKVDNLNIYKNGNPYNLNRIFKFNNQAYAFFVPYEIDGELRIRNPETKEDFKNAKCISIAKLFRRVDEKGDFVRKQIDIMHDDVELDDLISGPRYKVEDEYYKYIFHGKDADSDLAKRELTVDDYYSITPYRLGGEEYLLTVHKRPFSADEFFEDVDSVRLFTTEANAYSEDEAREIFLRGDRNNVRSIDYSISDNNFTGSFVEENHLITHAERMSMIRKQAEIREKNKKMAVEEKSNIENLDNNALIVLRGSKLFSTPFSRLMYSNVDTVQDLETATLKSNQGNLLSLTSNRNTELDNFENYGNQDNTLMNFDLSNNNVKVLGNHHDSGFDPLANNNVHLNKVLMKKDKILNELVLYKFNKNKHKKSIDDLNNNDKLLIYLDYDYFNNNDFYKFNIDTISLSAKYYDLASFSLSKSYVDNSLDFYTLEFALNHNFNFFLYAPFDIETSMSYSYSHLSSLDNGSRHFHNLFLRFGLFNRYKISRFLYLKSGVSANLYLNKLRDTSEFSPSISLMNDRSIFIPNIFVAYNVTTKKRNSEFFGEDYILNRNNFEYGISFNGGLYKFINLDFLISRDTRNSENIKFRLNFEL